MLVRCLQELHSIQYWTIAWRMPGSYIYATAGSMPLKGEQHDHWFNFFAQQD